MKVKTLIANLQELEQEAEIHIYAQDGNPVEPDGINCANNDDDYCNEYHLFSKSDME